MKTGSNINFITSQLLKFTTSFINLVPHYGHERVNIYPFAEINWLFAGHESNENIKQYFHRSATFCFFIRFTLMSCVTSYESQVTS